MCIIRFNSCLYNCYVCSRSSLYRVFGLRGDTRMLCCTEVQGETELYRIFHADLFPRYTFQVPWFSKTSVCFDAFQVGNMKKETTALWYKDGREIKAEEHLGFTEGVLKLEIAQVRKLWWVYKYIYIYIRIYVFISVLYNCLWIHLHIWL